MEQQIRFVDTRFGQIAYATAGSGFQPLPGASHIAFFGDTSPMLDAALDSQPAP